MQCGEKDKIMSYVKLLYHIVIKTKGREPVLSIEHSDDLYRCIWNIVKNKNSVLYRVNGTEDHVHLLISLHQSIALADFMRELKAKTSKILKSTKGYENFVSWSEGYAALTYSEKDKDMIINYIKKQREHHKQFSFREELEGLLKEFEMTLDERDWAK